MKTIKINSYKKPTTYTSTSKYYYLNYTNYINPNNNKINLPTLTVKLS